MRRFYRLISIVEVGVLLFLRLKRSRMFNGDFEHPTRRGGESSRFKVPTTSGRRPLNEGTEKVLKGRDNIAQGDSPVY